MKRHIVEKLIDIVNDEATFMVTIKEDWPKPDGEVKRILIGTPEEIALAYKEERHCIAPTDKVIASEEPSRTSMIPGYITTPPTAQDLTAFLRVYAKVNGTWSVYNGAQREAAFENKTRVSA